MFTSVFPEMPKN